MGRLDLGDAIHDGWQAFCRAPRVVAAFALLMPLLGAVAARFRDIPMIVTSVMQISFFVTPVMWQAQQLTERAQLVVHWNPLAAFLELLRAPLLGHVPSSEAWALASATLVLLMAMWISTHAAVVPWNGIRLLETLFCGLLAV